MGQKPSLSQRCEEQCGTAVSLDHSHTSLVIKHLQCTPGRVHISGDKHLCSILTQAKRTCTFHSATDVTCLPLLSQRMTD